MTHLICFQNKSGGYFVVVITSGISVTMVEWLANGPWRGWPGFETDVGVKFCILSCAKKRSKKKKQKREVAVGCDSLC